MIVCADVFGDLKIYVSEAVARFARSRIYRLHFSCRYIWGACPPPPPYQNAGYASGNQTEAEQGNTLMCMKHIVRFAFNIVLLCLPWDVYDSSLQPTGGSEVRDVYKTTMNNYLLQ